MHWLNPVFSKPHLLGWLFNMFIVLFVSSILVLNYVQEGRDNQSVQAVVSKEARQIFNSSAASGDSRVLETEKLASVIYESWPRVMKGNNSQYLQAKQGYGPLLEEYNAQVNKWETLRTFLLVNPNADAVAAVNTATAEWIAENTFYQTRLTLFTIWIALVSLYVFFVSWYVIPRSTGSGKTESLLLIVDAGLYFAVISWFTKTEIQGLGWIILFPVAVVFFEMFRLRDKKDEGGVYIAAVIFLFFLFFGVLQLRIDYDGATATWASAAAALRDFLEYVCGGAILAFGLLCLFKLAHADDPPSGSDRRLPSEGGA